MNRQVQKIIILGSSGVGKTSIMERYVAERFSPQYKTTIGADFSTKEVVCNGQEITLQIWDTAGQERFQSLGVAFYRGADACVLVYDVTDPASFNKLESWREEFVRSAGVADAKDFPFVVMGNKADMEKFTVSQDVVKQWCDAKGGIPHFTVSAKTGDGVEQAFLKIVTAATKRVKDEEPIIPDTLKLSEPRAGGAGGSSGGGCAC